MPIAPARVAWYVTGRFYQNEKKQLMDVGYFLHLSGVRGPLFTGEKSEATAVLTFHSEPFGAEGITNGNISIGLDAVGRFSVYYNPEGGATFEDPASFSRGQCVATFERVSVVMGETFSSPLLGGFAISMNVFSADLIHSTPFEHEGVRYDLRELLPHGITQFGTASANTLAVFPPYTRIVAFTGSAIAAGSA
jgi:hypothetical protein